MAERLDLDRISFYGMTEEELWAARQLRLRDLREIRTTRLRIAIRHYGSLFLLGGLWLAFGAWFPIVALSFLPELLLLGIVAAWSLLLFRLIRRSPLADRWKRWEGELREHRALKRTHKASIRQLDDHLARVGS